MHRQLWLETLEKGSEVCITSFARSDKKTKANVERVTPLYIIVNNMRFSKQGYYKLNRYTILMLKQT